MAHTTDFSGYRPLIEAFGDEVVTHSHLEDVALPHGAGTLALIRLDNGEQRRPSTLGPRSLVELGETLAGQIPRAESGEIVGLAVTGTGPHLAAGADLGAVNAIEDRSLGRMMAELGHQAYALLEDFPAPTFAFINGTALGGGLEIALAAHHRTVSDGAKGLGLPEIFLGLVPGWGGMHRLPRIAGPENAATVIFTNALAENRTLRGPAAHQLGLADVLLEAADFERQSLDFAARMIAGDEELARQVDEHRAHADDSETWHQALSAARRAVAAKTGDSAPAPLRALELFEEVPRRDRDAAVEAECEALADLMVTDEFADTVYAFLELVQKRAKHPAGVPEAAPREVTSVGVVGAGLMATQLALLFAERLQVPVALTDVDDARVSRGLERIRAELDRRVERGRLESAQAEALRGLITGSTDKSVYAGCDLIIEAVFEETSVKKQVFAELEEIVPAEAVLATNTSSLSVSAMAEDLRHPERVIGFHFFNPVAKMPLIEIARTPRTADEPIATAFALAARLGKSPVLTRDTTAFVVNRVLLRLMSEVQRAVDEGTDPETADTALRPLGLPMSTFDLLAMVGLPVAQHVTESLHASFGARFHVSANLQRLIDHGVTGIWAADADGGARRIPEETAALLEQGDTPRTAEQLLRDVEDALAEEISLMLDEGVVSSPKDIDLCMILGAGWPMHRGGITPHLDHIGASERVAGRRLHR